MLITNEKGTIAVLDADRRICDTRNCPKAFNAGHCNHGCIYTGILTHQAAFSKVADLGSDHFSNDCELRTLECMVDFGF